jgi:acyl carrier protein
MIESELKTGNRDNEEFRSHAGAQRSLRIGELAVESLLREIFRSELGIGDDAFSRDLAYNSTPEWDSATHLILIMSLEDKLGFEFLPDEVVEMTTVAKILHKLDSREMMNPNSLAPHK